MHNDKNSLLSLYIHIPFCLSKCSYCDFTSFANSVSIQNPYIDALIKEIHSYKNQILSRGIKTIFIGGGTPTSLSDSLFEKLLYNIDEILNLNLNESDVEYTVEANPKTISHQKALTLKKYGVNRVSFGLQSSNPKELSNLGRVHNFEDLKESVTLLKNNGITDINIDLMYAIPDQTIETFKKSLNDVIGLSVTHISAYSLILEEGTKLYELYNQNKLTIPTEDEDIFMYEEAIKILAKNGYHQYEISNFSLPGKECKHNITYWKVDEYLGFGLSSHSFFCRQRYSNTTDINKYIDDIINGDLPIEQTEEIDEAMAFEEWIFLRLRMNEGIDVNSINENFQMNFLEKYFVQLENLQAEGLLQYDSQRVFLTIKGFELSNYVFITLLT